MLNLLTRMFLAASSAGKSAAEAASEVGTPDPGWLNRLINQLYDPVWNVDHRLQIYCLIVLVLIATGFGLPTPEESWLMLAGFTTWLSTGGEFVWYMFFPVLVLCCIGNVIGDLVPYFMGRKWGLGVRERFKFIKKSITDKRLARVQGWFDNYGLWTVFFGRLLTGVRLVTFVMAGTMKVKWWKFALVDFASNMLSTPLWLFLGVLVAQHGREYADEMSKQLSIYVLEVAGGMLVCVAIYYVIKSRRRSAREAAAPAPEVDLSKLPAGPAQVALPGTPDPDEVELGPVSAKVPADLPLPETTASPAAPQD